MRLVAIGDTHLKASAPRNALRLKALQQIVTVIDAQPPDAVLWPGDLFDRTSTIDDRNTLAGFMLAIADRCPVIAVRGNHDAIGDLNIFRKLRARHPIHIALGPDVVALETVHGRLAVACLPYPEEGALVAQGWAPADLPHAANVALDAIFMLLADRLSEARDGGALTVFIGHANLAGARVSTGQPLIGHEIALRPEHLDRLGSTPKLLSHIHEPQDLHGATYLGSIAPMDWAEVTPRRFLVLEHTGEEWVQTSVPIDVPALYHVEGHLTRDTFTWQVTNGPGGVASPAPVSWAGHHVRVRYTFAAIDRVFARDAQALLRAEFTEAALVELDPVVVSDRAIRAPEVAAARSLGDKVAAWAALQGTTLSDSVRAKLDALQHQDHATVLAQLEARLQDLRRLEVSA